MLEAVTQPAFTIPLEASDAIYLLLESEALEDYLRTLPDAPDQLSAHDHVKKIDYCTFARWVWSDTDYEAYESRGPLLVQCEVGSPLVGVFQEEWAAHDAGLMIRSAAGMNEVLAHLRRILFVQLAGDGPARFRLQEPLALASVLQALAPHRAAALLGPLHEVVWRENTGPTYQWWRYSHAEDMDGEASDFLFMPTELAAIDAGLAERFVQAQVALTEQLNNPIYENPERQVRFWISQLNEWGYLERSEVADALDIFRHPRFVANAESLVDTLQNTEMTTATRIITAQHHLATQGA